MVMLNNCKKLGARVMKNLNLAPILIPAAVRLLGVAPRLLGRMKPQKTKGGKLMKIKTRFVVAASLAFSLISASAGAVTVFVQYDGSTVLTDPALVSASGSDFEASASLQSGEFKGRAEGAGSTDQNAYSGNLGTLIFTNNTGSQVVIGAGNFTAHVQGDYSFGGGPNQSAQTSASLQVRIAGGTQLYRIGES